MAVTGSGITSRCSNISSFLSLKRAKKPFPEALYQTSLCRWLELVQIINPKSFTGEHNGSVVISDQDLPLDRASLPFSHGKEVDIDRMSLLVRKKERKKEPCIGNR